MEKVTERYNYSNYYNRCYKMKLYLEQFNIPCCVLNSELPVATRLHTVSFHSNIYFHFTYLHAHHLTGTRLHVQIASFLSFAPVEPCDTLHPNDRYTTESIYPQIEHLPWRGKLLPPPRGNFAPRRGKTLPLRGKFYICG